MIKTYRKKPVIVQAMRWMGDYDELVKLTGSLPGDTYHVNYTDHGSLLVIHTLDGNMIAAEGDYIVKGIAGEFYPCRSDIFQVMYEEVRAQT